MMCRSNWYPWAVPARKELHASLERLLELAVQWNCEKHYVPGRIDRSRGWSSHRASGCACHRIIGWHQGCVQLERSNSRDGSSMQFLLLGSWWFLHSFSLQTASLWMCSGVLFVTGLLLHMYSWNSSCFENRSQLTHRCLVGWVLQALFWTGWDRDTFIGILNYDREKYSLNSFRIMQESNQVREQSCWNAKHSIWWEVVWIFQKQSGWYPDIHWFSSDITQSELRINLITYYINIWHNTFVMNNWYNIDTLFYHWK